MPRVKMSEILADPRKLTEIEGARLDAMSEADIELMVEQDADAPALSDDQLDRAVFARTVRQTREQTGLTQEVFARRYAINLSRLRAWERGQMASDSMTAAYLKVIRHDPGAVLKALETRG